MSSDNKTGNSSVIAGVVGQAAAAGVRRPPAPPTFCTLVCRNLPVVDQTTAKQLAEKLESTFPFAVVRNINIPEPTMKTAFVEFMNDGQALQVCELAQKKSVKLGASTTALELDWPRGMEPFRQLKLVKNPKSAAAAMAEADEPGPLPSKSMLARPPTPTTTLSNPTLKPFTRLWMLPVFAFSLGVFTLASTMYMAKRDHFLPATKFLIPISLWSNNAPASHVYALGLSLVGTVLLICAIVLWPVLQWIGDLVPSHRLYCRAAAVAGLVAPVCMVVQATVPLTPAFSNVLTGIPLPPLTTQDIVHQLAAALFFVAGVAHNYAVVQLWDHLSGDSAPRLVKQQLPITRFSYRQKYGTLICQAMVPVANVLHPVVWQYLDLPMDHNARLAVTAVAQYIVVGSLLLFFASYARDFSFLHIQVVFSRRATDFNQKQHK